MNFSNADREQIERLVGRITLQSQRIDDILAKIDSIEEKIEAYMRDPEPARTKVVWLDKKDNDLDIMA
jgi:chromosome segregation ATPase